MMTIEEQFEQQRGQWRDDLSSEDRLAMIRALLHVGDTIAGDDKLRENVEKVLAYVAAEQALSLDDPKFSISAEEAHRRDTYDRGVLSGMDRSLRHLTDQKVISSMVEELRPEKRDEKE